MKASEEFRSFLFVVLYYTFFYPYEKFKNMGT